jgi:hypothetical protein
VSEKRRVVRLQEPEASGQWFEYEVTDHGNTEVAEQTFNRLRRLQGVIKVMKMNHAIFHLRTMVDYINVHCHNALVKKGMEPSGEKASVHRSKVRKPERLLEMSLAGDTGGALEDVE